MVLKVGSFVLMSFCLLVGCSHVGRPGDQCAGFRYSAELKEIRHGLVLPLFVPVEGDPENELYCNVAIVMAVEKIYADSKLLHSSEHDYDYDCIDFGTFTSKESWCGYLFFLVEERGGKAFSLVYFSDIQEDDWTMREYAIPRDTRLLEIHYRPRYPKNKLGETIVVTARQY